MTSVEIKRPFDRTQGDLEPYQPPERHAAAWLVTVPDGTTLAMLGERCRQSEALASARVIWPECEVE